jgi:hypothetical protein
LNANDRGAARFNPLLIDANAQAGHFLEDQPAGTNAGDQMMDGLIALVKGLQQKKLAQKGVFSSAD